MCACALPSHYCLQQWQFVAPCCVKWECPGCYRASFISFTQEQTWLLGKPPGTHTHIDGNTLNAHTCLANSNHLPPQCCNNYFDSPYFKMHTHTLSVYRSKLNTVLISHWRALTLTPPPPTSTSSSLSQWYFYFYFFSPNPSLLFCSRVFHA